MLNTKNGKPRTAKETEEARRNGLESTTTKYGKQMEENETHIERSQNMSDIVQKVKKFLVIFS